MTTPLTDLHCKKICFTGFSLNKNVYLMLDPIVALVLVFWHQLRKNWPEKCSFTLFWEFPSITRMFSNFSRFFRDEQKGLYILKICSRYTCSLFWLDHVFHSLAFPLQRIPLSHLTRADINNLLAELGFYKKTQAEDDVPEEFRFSPAKDSPFKEHHTRAPANSHLPEEPQPERESPHKDL